MPAPVTSANPPPRHEGEGGKRILGLKPQTFWIVLGVSVVGGYVYLKYIRKQPPASGAGTGGGGGGGQRSPTGLSRQHLTVWVKDHHGHRHG